MGSWFVPDFHAMFAPQLPLGETFLRGTFVFLALSLLIRIAPKRQMGHIAPNDMLAIVIVGGIAVAGMAKEAMALPDVLLLVGTILLWGFVLDWLGYHFPRLRPFLREQPSRLVENGRFLAANLRREMVTEEEVQAELRKQGIHQLREIQEACLEADGRVSVVKTENGQASGEEASTSPARTTASPRDGGPRTAETSAEGEVPAHEPDVRAFLQAVRQLQERVAWHQQQIAGHQEAVRQVKEILARHGAGRKASPRGPARARADQTPAKP